MKPRLLPPIILSIVLFILACSVSATEPEQPSSEEVTGAITRSLQAEIPISWVGNLMGGRLIKLDELKVIRIGIYNKEQKYWPMQVRCVGLAALVDPFNQGKQVHFDKVGDFLIHRDDYGDWQAEMRRGMFQ